MHVNVEELLEDREWVRGIKVRGVDLRDVDWIQKLDGAA